MLSLLRRDLRSPLYRDLLQRVNHLRARKWIGEADRRLFKSEGYMVIRRVIPARITRRAVRDIAAFVGADLGEPSTWYGGHPQNDGIVPLHHAQSLWDVRQHPALHEVFSEFWGTRKLMVDINRCCFRPPCHPDWPTVSRGGIHWDTDPRTPGEGSLQGIVLLTDVGKNAGGFQCLPPIYQDLPVWLSRNAAHEAFDFFNPGLASTGATQITGSAGDLILWSTRLPHGPAINLSTRPRVAQFVSMGPPVDCDELRLNMTAWWQEKRAPTYWRGLAGQLDPEPGPPAQLTPHGRRLIGALDWE